MIHESAHNLESHGFRIVQALTDPDGTIGYGVERGGEKFVLVAKEYAFKGLASFMESLVKKAKRHGFMLLFYENDGETYTVFDSAYYTKHGKLSRGRSKTRDTRWLELPLDEGVALDEYLRGAGLPTTLAGENETLGGFA